MTSHSWGENKHKTLKYSKNYSTQFTSYMYPEIPCLTYQMAKNSNA